MEKTQEERLNKIFEMLEFQPYSEDEFRKEPKQGMKLGDFYIPIGSVLACKNPQHLIEAYGAFSYYLVGDTNVQGWYGGCGCCTDDLEIAGIAHIMDAIERSKDAV